MVPDIWCVTDVIVIFHFGLFFVPLKAKKNKILKKLRKTNGDIITLHKWTKKHDHMLYCSLDMAGNRCHCDFSFWAKKNQNLKKMKKILGHIIILYMCTKNYNQMMYGS